MNTKPIVGEGTDSDPILSSDPRSAKCVWPGWWQPRGQDIAYHDEQMARSMGATHRRCPGSSAGECGQVIPRNRLRCNGCQNVYDRDRWERREAIEYTGGPFFIDDGEVYFDDLDTALDDDSIDGDIGAIVERMPRSAVHATIHEIDPHDQWGDSCVEDGDPPGWLLDAVEALNRVIRDHGGIDETVYFPGPHRLIFGDGPSDDDPV